MGHAKPADSPAHPFHAQYLNIGAIVGSLRSESFNRSLFELSQELAPHVMRIAEIPIGDLPFFDQDIEPHPPEPVHRYWEQLRTTDGLLFFVPEYNYSIPGVLKNAIDWGSRPRGDAPMPGKPAAIMGASVGRSGTMRAQLHVRQILTGMNLQVMNKPDILVPFAGEKISDCGHITDESVRDQVKSSLEGFEKWIQRHS